MLRNLLLINFKNINILFLAKEIVKILTAEQNNEDSSRLGGRGGNLLVVKSFSCPSLSARLFQIRSINRADKDLCYYDVYRSIEHNRESDKGVSRFYGQVLFG